MNRIQELRERKNLSQAQLAEMLGVSTKTVQAWERGEQTPDERTIAMLCSMLECTNGYLFKKTEFNRPLFSTKPRENTAHRIQPITCSRCGSRSLAFVTEYHFSILLRIIETLSFIVLIAVAINGFSDILSYSFSARATSSMTTSDSETAAINAIITIIIVAVVYFIIRLIRTDIESKTHVQAICKDCGNLWLLN